MTALLLFVLAVQLAAQPRGRLFRGPLFSDRAAILVQPERPLPIEFQGARLHLGSPAPWATLSNARLHADVRSNTLRSVSIRNITLRVAAGPAEHGIYTFRMRGSGTLSASGDFNRLPADGLFRPAIFVAMPHQTYPGILLLDRETKVVFTLERVDDDSGQPVFENPEATELLWEALGRPSISHDIIFGVQFRH